MKKRLLLLFFLCMAAQYAVFSQGKDPEIQPFISEITAFEQADQANFPPKKCILFTGSSSIRYWTTLQESFPGKKVVNRGFGGSGLSNLIYYADRIIFPYKPRQVVIYSGENDIAGGKTAQQVFDEFRILAEKIKQKLTRTRITYISMKPSPSRSATIPEVKKANALIEAYLKENKRGDYINIFDPMLNSAQEPREELFESDRLHMNEKGYALWTEIVRPYLR
jgi:lysophospholipase L1-like esterase